jgi:hypothetical protein
MIAATVTVPSGNIHDFDFLVGAWNVLNRRLKRRWSGSADWDEFPATHSCEKHIGGLVNVDEIEFPTRGFSGMSVRVFDLEQRRWAIYWVNSGSGILFPPVFGGFTGNRGEFYGEDVDEGEPVKVKYLWTRFSPDIARWEQAFSRDGGVWETNWVMDFTRAEDPA